ncbi:MAG: hypothetical protein WKG00_03840 [Polyangiaceae bacterium]
MVIVDATRGWAIVGAGGDCDQHCLVPIDPMTGAAVPPALTFGIDEMYGLAWSMGIAYGFHFDGRVFEVDLATSNILEVPKGGDDDYGDGVWGAASAPAPPAPR